MHYFNPNRHKNRPYTRLLEKRVHYRPKFDSNKKTFQNMTITFLTVYTSMVDYTSCMYIVQPTFLWGGKPFVMLILMYAYTIIYMCRITFVIKDV